jgi:hypothetical protein
MDTGTIISRLQQFSGEEKIQKINELQKILAKENPIQHPVANVQWIPADEVTANDYNPNRVAPPEMKLLYHSIKMDGYTQPIVAYWDEEKNKYIIVD